MDAEQVEHALCKAYDDGQCRGWHERGQEIVEMIVHGQASEEAKISVLKDIFPKQEDSP